MKNEQIRQIAESYFGSNLMPKQPADSKFVLFVDLLGFASLTEANPLDLSAIRAHERIFSEDFGFGCAFFSEEFHNPLIKAFMGFHRSIKWSIINIDLEK